MPYEVHSHFSDCPAFGRLCSIFNETVNSIRPREYDGSHIRFSGMNPEITLRPHQVNAIAHIMYGEGTPCRLIKWKRKMPTFYCKMLNSVIYL